MVSKTKKSKPSQASPNGHIAAASVSTNENVEKLVSFLQENESEVLERDYAENRETLRGLEDWQRESYISKLADSNLRALGLLKQCLHATRQAIAGQPIHKAPGAVSVKDLEVNPAESIHKQYSDMVLWTETARTNAKVFGAAEKQLTRAAAVKDGPDMRDLYMGQVTEAFGDELDKLRTESNLDAGRVVALAEALEQGKDIWNADEIAMWCAQTSGASVQLIRQNE